MMVIDSHLHLIRRKNFNTETYKRLKLGLPHDTEIENLIEWLKEAAVVKAVVMGQEMDRIWNTTFGDDYVLEVFRKYPDFFIPLVSCEPLDKVNRFNKEAFEYFKKSVDEDGFKGLLLTPPYGQFMSNDKTVYPFYQFAQERDIIVQYHHSAQIGPAILAPSKYAEMVNLNDVIIDFPDLKLVVEHLGYPQSESLFVLMANDKNLYADLAMTFKRPMWLTWNLVIAKEYGVIDRIMYASDFLASGYDLISNKPAEDFKGYINFIKDGLNHICDKCGWPIFTNEEIQGILWKNAARLYNIKI